MELLIHICGRAGHTKTSTFTFQYGATYTQGVIVTIGVSTNLHSNMELLILLTITSLAKGFE